MPTSSLYTRLWADVLETVQLATDSGATVTHIQSRLTGVIRAMATLTALALRLKLDTNAAMTVLYLVDGKLAVGTARQAMQAHPSLQHLLTDEIFTAGKIHVCTYREFVHGTAAPSPSHATYVLELGCGIISVDMVIAGGELLDSMHGHADRPGAVNVLTLSTGPSLHNEDMVFDYIGTNMADHQVPSLMPKATWIASMESAQSKLAEAFSAPIPEGGDKKQHVVCCMSAAQVHLLANQESFPTGVKIVHVTKNSAVDYIRLTLEASKVIFRVNNDVTLCPLSDTVTHVFVSGDAEIGTRFDPLSSKIVHTRLQRNLSELPQLSALAPIQCHDPNSADEYPGAEVLLLRGDVMKPGLGNGDPVAPAFNGDLEYLIYTAASRWSDRTARQLPVIWPADWPMVTEYIRRLQIRNCVLFDGPYGGLRLPEGRASEIHRCLAVTEHFESAYLLAGVDSDTPLHIKRVVSRLASILSMGIGRIYEAHKPFVEIGLASLRPLCRGAGRSLCGNGAIWTALGIFEDCWELAVATQSKDSTKVLLDGRIVIDKAQVVAIAHRLQLIEAALSLDDNSAPTVENLSPRDVLHLEKELTRAFLFNLTFIPPMRHQSENAFAWDICSNQPMTRHTDEAIDFSALSGSGSVGHFALHTTCDLLAEQDVYQPVGLTLISHQAVVEVCAEFGAGTDIVRLLRTMYPEKDGGGA